MKRYVIMADSLSGIPVYVAENEADAARFLDEMEKEMRKVGKKVERRNSLSLVQNDNIYRRWEVHAVTSWEPECDQIPDADFYRYQSDAELAS